jgi:hypothetical protein
MHAPLRRPSTNISRQKKDLVVLLGRARTAAGAAARALVRLRARAAAGTALIIFLVAVVLVALLVRHLVARLLDTDVGLCVCERV